jgi:hypothetical protein
LIIVNVENISILYLTSRAVEMILVKNYILMFSQVGEGGTPRG